MSEQTKVAKTGITRAKGRLYFLKAIDGKLTVKSCTRGGGDNRTEAETNAKYEDGYMYFLDKAGDVARVRRKNA